MLALQQEFMESHQGLQGRAPGRLQALRLQRTDGLRRRAVTRRPAPAVEQAGRARRFVPGLGDGITLFGRYGKLVKGELPFNQAITAGAEVNGSYWGRAGDAIGLAGAWLQAGKAYRAGMNGQSCAGGYNDSGDCLGGAFSFVPQGAEKLAEIYYRYRLSPQFQLTPDFQYITQGGGNTEAKAVKVFALRANIAY